MTRWLTLVLAVLLLLLALPGLPVAAFANEGAGDGLVVEGAAAVEQTSELELREARLRLVQYGEQPSYAEGQLEAQFLGNLSEAQLKQLATELGESMRRMDKESKDLSTYRFSEDEIITLLEFAVNTQPDLWFTSSSFSYWANRDGTVRRVAFSYVADKTTIDSMQQKYYVALDDLLSWVPSNATPAEQVKAVHDWLVRKLAYNERAAELGYYGYGVTLEDNPWSSYTALVRKSAVCQGYSLAFAAALTSLGLDSCLTHAPEHVWNRVKLGNYWYHVDVTWDDPVPDGGFFRTPRTSYFLKSDAGLRAVNIYDATHQSWTLVKPACNDPRYDNKDDWTSYDGPASQDDDNTGQDMYRLYNPNSGEHFYTSNVGERNSLRAACWKYEGVGWVAPERGNAVWRLYNPVGGKHHYTTSVDERDALLAAGWQGEGVGWYSDPSRRVPLLRLYSPADGEHHYTTDAGERDALVAIGWKDEGIGWYGVATGSGA